ncbi:MAG: DUF5685 family protein [Oscillospiraceae bacterium]|jgi:hypothetical protein|nr:DUF5685 family protein [Oscillospiraceae bacterium]
MFGFVTANAETLSEEQKHRYKAVYCGLCRSLKQRHGFLGRIALNYDMAFLVLTLSSLYEPEGCFGCERCFIHPVKKHDYETSELSAYAADMTVALSYLNALDNWQDERDFLSLVYARLLRRKFRKVSLLWPRQCGAMTSCIDALSALEASGRADPDAGSKLFGQLMAELFVYKEDRWQETLRAMGGFLGEFIYIMDAFMDLETDARRGRYNPLAGLQGQGADEKFFLELLTVLIGNCTLAYEKLPIVEDAELLRNILYSGVWTRYERREKRKKAKIRR